jgi:hypothetical protein
MAHSVSVVRAARKNLEQAERQITRLDAQFAANQQIAQQVRDNLAAGNQALKFLGSPQDILRECDQHSAELLQLRASAEKIVADAHEIIRQASDAAPPS